MYTVAIVDDEKTISEGIKSLFPWEQIGFTAISFSDPRIALAYMKDHPVDVLLTDIEMPGISGIELCQKVKELDEGASAEEMKTVRNEDGTERAYPAAGSRDGKDASAAGSRGQHHTRIVFISSHQNYEYFRSAIRYGVEDYILKPIRSSDILDVFGRIHEQLDAERGAEAAEQPQSYYDKIKEGVVDYLKVHYQDARLEDAAVEVSLSPAYLSRILKEKCGTGFSDLLVKIRMEKAAELLLDIHYRTYDIAYYVGYDNPKSFSRAFHNYYGVTPTEYRSGKRGSVPQKTD